MPTGYTDDVGKGIITDFRTYALQCARAFGACIMLRDEPLSPEIPEFEPARYYLEELTKAEAMLENFEQSTDDQLRVKMQDQIRESTEYHLSCIAKNDAVRERYEAMLAKARAFQPPTPEHEKYSKFLVDQLIESIDFDCNNEYHEEILNRSLSFDDWKQNELNELRRRVEYRRAVYADELARVKSRNEWVSALKAALEPANAIP